MIFRLPRFTGLCQEQILAIIIFSICKQLLDEMFVISAIITVELSVISQGCDNTNQDVDYSGYHKIKFSNIVLLYIVSK